MKKNNLLKKIQVLKQTLKNDQTKYAQMLKKAKEAILTSKSKSPISPK